MRYTTRKLSGKVLFSLRNNPVVFLNGLRQSGKTTLARKLARGDYPAEYVSFGIRYVGRVAFHATLLLFFNS